VSSSWHLRQCTELSKEEGQEMNLTPLYWVDGPWPGKLALSARPRGGDWLEDEVQAWRREGLAIVCSLLEPHEERDLDLARERDEVRASEMRFVSLPIGDRKTPGSEAEMRSVANSLLSELRAGGKVAVHCRQGVGRAGLTAACVLLAAGESVGSALQLLTKARGVEIPETTEQRLWLNRYARLS